MNRLRAALFGSPVAHSLSPVLQSTAGRTVGVEVEYHLRDVKTEGLRSAVDWARAEGLSGFNVTAPHKGAICSLLDELTPLARTLGAVNTVILEPDGRAIGTNTDVYGFMQSAQDLPAGRILILGAGGAAMAVAQGCIELGREDIYVLSRRPEQADRIANVLGSQVKSGRLAIGEVPLDSCGVLINCLPPTAIPMFESLRFHSMAATSLIYDLNYGGRDLILSSAAGRADLRFVDGLDMLVWQGIRAFQLWTGRQPDYDLVFRELALATA